MMKVEPVTLQGYLVREESFYYAGRFLSSFGLLQHYSVRVAFCQSET
jgi:hypothetical protein